MIYWNSSSDFALRGWGSFIVMVVLDDPKPGFCWYVVGRIHRPSQASASPKDLTAARPSTTRKESH